MDEVVVDEAAWRPTPRLIAAAACFLLGAAILALGLAPRLAPAAPPADIGLDALAPEAAPAEAEAPAAAELVVYVTGAVVAPDVYSLAAGARVKDAVVAAGGLRADAAAEQVNLAEPVSDAQHIHVPVLGAEPAAAGAMPAGAAAAAGAELIDLNRASAAELEELPGVGTVLAERIVARREEGGPFTSVDALREVAGVGPKLYEQIAPLLSVGR